MSSTLPQSAKLGFKTVQGKLLPCVTTSFAAESFEGQRIVKSSRGKGGLYFKGAFESWETKGVGQEAGNLQIWGPPSEGTVFDRINSSEGIDQWPLEGPEAWEFLRAFVQCWTELQKAGRLPERFTPYSLLPSRVSDSWAFSLLPVELATILTSSASDEEKRIWEAYKHPDAKGTASWAFASAALFLRLVQGPLPWDQDEETLLRQEIRALHRVPQPLAFTVTFPKETLSLIRAGLGGHETETQRWTSWATTLTYEEIEGITATGNQEDRVKKQEADRKRRTNQRQQTLFWRRRGAAVTGIGIFSAVLLALIGWYAWEQLKPDVTDKWSPEQVVRGYYDAIGALDDRRMKKLVFDGPPSGSALKNDLDEISNLFVVKQVRYAYEKQDPALQVQKWIDLGKPPLAPGQFLIGLSQVSISNQGSDLWKVEYVKMETVGPGTETHAPRVAGFSIVDELKLKKNSRGWKIADLHRTRAPLP